ncbi:hypothetical protein JCM16303_004934, partial [Sporobolomyces ruberrimus]
MATPLSGFQALPPELVSHIISLAAPIAATEDPVARRQRWRTLNGICLVSSEWRTVAQKILLSDGTIRLNRTKELDALIDLVVDIPEQGITKLVRSLDVTMWGQEPGRLVELLSLCENLEELVIEHVDRVRLDQIITPTLRSFSARQCTFISSAPFSSSPYPTLSIYPSLKSLDLRHNSFRFSSLPSHPTSFPSLQNLLFFTGSLEQSSKTVQTFLRTVSPRLKSLSLDQGAWELGQLDLSSLHLTTLGLYWDSAFLSLVGSQLLLPPPPSSSSSSLSTTTPSFSLPEYIHFSLYPSSIPSLLKTFTTLFETIKNSGRPEIEWNWRNEKKVEHFRFEQTFRELELLGEEIPIPPLEEVISDDEEVEEEGEGRESRREEAGEEEEEEEEVEEEDPNQTLLKEFLQ